MTISTPHQVNTFTDSDLDFKKELASSFGMGSNKKLEVEFFQGCYTYIVTNKDKRDYVGNSAAKAVDVYNDILNTRNKSKTHTIEHFPQHELLFSRTMASSYGQRSAKELNVKVQNCVFTYEVKNKKEIEYSGTSAMKAIDLYNEFS